MAKWKPMERAKPLPLHPTRRREMVRWAESVGYNADKIEEIIAEAETATTYMNDLYVATVVPADKHHENWPDMVQLSIRRLDRRAIHDWRHLQQIKTDLFGPDAEAVELYPSSTRVVDTANSYHLFVLVEPGTMFPFGWTQGLRTEQGIAGIAHQQRPGATQ